MTNHAAQILAFPLPKQSWEDCDDPYEAVFQLKLEVVKMLNEVAAGRYILSEGNVHGINKINALCAELGIAPLDF